MAKQAAPLSRILHPDSQTRLDRILRVGRIHFSSLPFKTNKEIRMLKSFARTMVLFIGVLALAATPSMAQGGGAGQGAGRSGQNGGGRGGAGIVTLAVSSTSFPD